MAPRGFLFAALVALVADATTSGCEGDVCIAGEVFAEVPETSFDNHISLLQKTAELRAIDKAMYQIKDNEKNEENSEEGGDHEHRDDLPKSSEDKEAAELRAIDKKKKPVAMYPTKENHKNEEEDEQTDDQEELVNVTRGHKDARAELEEKGIEEELMAELEDEEVDEEEDEEEDEEVDEDVEMGGRSKRALVGHGKNRGGHGKAQGVRRRRRTLHRRRIHWGQSKPYYAFSHRTLDTTDIQRALDDGSNAIEIDVMAWWDGCRRRAASYNSRGCWWAQHDGQGNYLGGDFDPVGVTAAGDRLDTMLQYIKNHGEGKVAAVMLDIKNPDFCNPYHRRRRNHLYACSVEKIQQLVKQELGTKFNVIYDTFTSAEARWRATGQLQGYGNWHLGWKWLQANYRSCIESTDAELGFPGDNTRPHGMPKTFTSGPTLLGEYIGQTNAQSCAKLERVLSQGAKAACYWTVDETNEVQDTSYSRRREWRTIQSAACGNCIVHGHVAYAYSARRRRGYEPTGGRRRTNASWKPIVEKAKLVAAARGFEYPTSVTDWCQ